jgi:hypothetical protein
MNEQIKRDHHYVPRCYLKRWTTKDKPTYLWCLDKKKFATQHDKIKLVSNKSTSVKDSLYKFTGLNPLESRNVFSMLIEKNNWFSEDCKDDIWYELEARNMIYYADDHQAWRNYILYLATYSPRLHNMILTFTGENIDELQNDEMRQFIGKSVAEWIIYTHNKPSKYLTDASVQEKIKLMIEKDRYNNIEDEFATLESKVAPLIVQIINDNDLSFYKIIENKVILLKFLTNQYCRTKKLITKLVDGFTPLHQKFIERCISKPCQDIQSCYFQKSKRLHCKMLAMCAAQTRYRSLNTSQITLMISYYAMEIMLRSLRCHYFVVLKNNTIISFLTNDTPCYNIDADNCQQTDKFTIYYPIAPDTAILLSDQPQDKEYNQQVKQLTEQEVNFYNKFILDNAEQYVYANNKQDLEKVLTTINNNLQ